MLTFDLPPRAAAKISAIDRELAQRQDPLSQAFGTIMDAMFGMFSPSSSPPRSEPRSERTSARSGGPRSAPPPPPPPKPASLVPRALQILGFETMDGLTLERVKQRKQALAKVYHPDLPTGSAEQMRRVNAAADVIVAELAKRA